jgi:hypothetical protein
MAFPTNILTISLRAAAAIGFVAWFNCRGELCAQTAGSLGNRTAAARAGSGATSAGRGSTGTSTANLGNRQLGSGVPGFASGGAAATRAAAAVSPVLYTSGVNAYYLDSPNAQPQAGSAGGGLFNTAASPATAIAPFTATSKDAGQVLTPSGSAGQSALAGFIDTGVRQGSPMIAFAVDRAPPDQVGVAIAQRLNKLPSLHFLSAVRVDMVGGTAVLRGTVASEHDRDLAARVVMLEASVDRVVNLLVVRNPAAPTPPVPVPPPPGTVVRNGKA